MKKTILLAALLASTATFATAQDGGPRGPRPEFKIDLSKISEQAPQEFRDKAKAADKDGNGVLEGDELKEFAPKFEKPAFIADDKKIDVAKLTDAIKAADKNGDGFIDQDEQKAAFEAARKTFGPAFFGRFAPNPAPFAPRWGAPQPWGPGPQGDWNRGPRGARNKGPQGDRGRRCRDDRPQGERPNPDAPKAE